MPISYPNSSGITVTTTVAKNAPPYFPATINTTFPFSVTGTSPVEVGTFFLPSDFLYNLSGSSYYLTVVAFVTGASDATGSLVLAKNLLDIPVDITIKGHDNIFDFAIRQKASKNFHYIIQIFIRMTGIFDDRISRWLT